MPCGSLYPHRSNECAAAVSGDSRCPDRYRYDLSGHTGSNALDVLMRKPAPFRYLGWAIRQPPVWRLWITSSRMRSPIRQAQMTSTLKRCIACPLYFAAIARDDSRALLPLPAHVPGNRHALRCAMATSPWHMQQPGEERPGPWFALRPYCAKATRVSVVGRRQNPPHANMATSSANAVIVLVWMARRLILVEQRNQNNT